MAGKDLFEDLCKFYEFMLGPLPRREEFKRTLQDTVTAEELSVFFLLPFSGPIKHEKLEKKARRADIPPDDLRARLDRLASEGFILAYGTLAAPVYERGNPVFMTEQQVRKPQDTPRRTFYAEFFNTLLEGTTTALPTKTPYFRVLPVEATVTGTTKSSTIVVDEVIPDPRGVLPIDVVSDMIKREAKLIGVAECYCRKTKRIVGGGCEYPLETCLVFDDLAQTLIEHGTARQINYEETMDILWRCEELGLVHNVDNCLEEIRSLCNCCPDCCAVMKAWERGYTNAGAPSRYVVGFSASKCKLCETCIPRCPTHARAIQDGRLTINTNSCLGCGLCVAACPQGANRMVLREQQPRIPRTNADLYGKIGREAIVGKIKSKILGR
jgi:Pyruvate/2-oxoacid:ferredoxin oxidoreductase delta subunit